MIRLPILFCVMSSILLCQPNAETQMRRAKLDAALLRLKDSGSPASSATREIADDLMSLADKRHPPSGPAVASFANVLATNLAGKRLTPGVVSQLTAPIVDVLQSAGTSTATSLGSMDHVTAVLTSMGVARDQAQATGARLRAIWLDVRGPEDLPVMRLQ